MLQRLSIWPVSRQRSVLVQVYDLLNGRKKLDVREDARKKVNVVGLKEWHVQEQGLVSQLIEHSSAARQTGQTGANSESSRSHSIMQFSLKKPKKDGEPGGREVRTYTTCTSSALCVALCCSLCRLLKWMPASGSCTSVVRLSVCS